MGTSKSILAGITFILTLINSGHTQIIEHLDGNKTSYEVNGNGEVLLFIHAGGLDRHLWKPQIQKFKNQYKVVTYDIRGHGASSFVGNDRSDIDDIISIIDKEAIQRVNIIGCSMGAILAIDFLLEYPNRVDQVVLVSPGLIGLQENDSLYQSQIRAYVSAIQKNDTSLMISKLKKMNAIGSDAHVLKKEVDEYVQKSLTDYVNRKGMLRPPNLKNWSPKDKLASIENQVLIIYGTEDHPYIFKNAQFIHKKISNSKIISIKQAAHLPNLERASDFNKILADFLRN